MVLSKQSFIRHSLNATNYRHHDDCWKFKDIKKSSLGIYFPQASLVPVCLLAVGWFLFRQDNTPTVWKQMPQVSLDLS
jgi:hypothetical protein